MSIAWATVVLVVLLTPGFLFISGFYAPHLVTRETVPFSPLGQLAGVVIISFFVHALAYAAINSSYLCKARVEPPDTVVACVDFDALASLIRADSVLPQGKQPANFNSMFDRHVGNIIGYFAIVAAAGFVLGFLAGKAVERGWLPLSRHQYLKMLEEGRRAGAQAHDNATAPWVRAHVLSKTAHDGNTLIYDGLVRDFYSKSDGTISYIVLRDAKRGIVKVSDMASAGERKALTDVAASDVLGGLLVLTSNDIANVYLEPLAQVKRSEASEALLEDKLRALPFDSDAAAAHLNDEPSG